MESKDPKKENKYAGLKKCFSALVDRKHVNLEIAVIAILLKTELGITNESNNEALNAALPYMFVFYVKNWPGWQRSREYYSGKLTYKDWFEKFRQYIVYRLNFLIKNGYDQALKVIEDENRQVSGQKQRVNQAVQVNLDSGSTVAPYTLNITCPPNIMTCLLFSQSGDDIILTRHSSLPWVNLSPRQLLNWPYVSVEFQNAGLYFKRKNCGDYFRYLNLSKQVSLPVQEFVESIDVPVEGKSRVCYSSKLLAGYVVQFKNVYKSLMPLPSETIATIFSEFIQDIEELPMNNTIATNTAVVFNIGKGYFFKKKRCEQGGAKETSNSVKLNEIYVPKIETTLYEFNDAQDLTTHSQLTFKGLNAIKPHQKEWTAKITFRCEYCEVSFPTDHGIHQHLQTEHGREGNFRCFKCNKEMSVLHLAGARWKHICYSK